MKRAGSQGVLLAIFLVFSGCAVLFPPLQPERMEQKPAVKSERVSVWDSRDPEVVYTQGMVEGLEGGAYNVLVGISRGALRWFEARKDGDGLGILVRFQRELVLLNHQLGQVKKNPALGKTMVLSDTEIQRLRAQMQKTTDLMFPVLHRVSETGGMLEVSKDGMDHRSLWFK